MINRFVFRLLILFDYQCLLWFVSITAITGFLGSINWHKRMSMRERKNMVKFSRFTQDLFIAIVSAVIGGVFTYFAGESQPINTSNIQIHIDGHEKTVSSDEISRLYAENISLQEKIEGLNKDLSDANQELQEVLNTAESNKALKEENQKNLAAMQENIQTLQLENSNLKSENDKLKSEILELKSTSQINIPTEAIVQPVENIPQNTENAGGDSVLLCNLDYITGKRMYLRGIETDNMGQEQSNVISTCNNRFIINGEYSTITGTMFISEKQKNYGKPHIKLYGDDNVLYDMQLEPGDQPIEFSVDISGVQQLDVKLYQNTHISELRLNK